MKALLLFILVVFPIKGISQIDVQGAFNPEKKQLILTLKNESDKNYNLRPITLIEGECYKFMSTITFQYKDKNNKVLHTTRKYVLYEYQPKDLYNKGQFLLEDQENQYKYNLATMYKGNIYKVDAIIQLEARIMDLSTQGIKDDEIYRKEVKRTYLWE